MDFEKGWTTRNIFINKEENAGSGAFFSFLNLSELSIAIFSCLNRVALSKVHDNLLNNQQGLVIPFYVQALTSKARSTVGSASSKRFSEMMISIAILWFLILKLANNSTKGIKLQTSASTSATIETVIQ